MCNQQVHVHVHVAFGNHHTSYPGDAPLAPQSLPNFHYSNGYDGWKKKREIDHYEFFWQLTREPRLFPTLKIKRNVEDIDSFKFEDFEIIGYDPHPTIKMKMAV